MCACDATGLTDCADNFTFIYLLPGFYCNAVHVTVHGYHALTVINEDGITIKKVSACVDDLSCSGCLDRAALCCRYIQTAVGAAWLFVEETS